MYDEFIINIPFFEIGPKVMLRAENSLELALFADSLSEKYGVDIIYTAQYTDIEKIAKKTKRLHVFAQHMDAVKLGRGIGAVLPEALVDAGAKGAMLNHTERPLTLSALEKAIERADQVGLASIVCADTLRQAQAVAHFAPNIILAEAPELIGGGKRTAADEAIIQRINEAVHSVNPHILVMHSAGISDETDVYSVIRSGAIATGSSSGIINAPDMFAMAERMIRAVREAYDAANSCVRNGDNYDKHS